jgi:signal transduction histidine kinase
MFAFSDCVRKLNRWMVVVALIVCEELALGLSLSREIAYAHGDNLTIDETPTGQGFSTVKVGASIILILPYVTEIYRISGA